ncbi:site-specific recombinase XerC [Blastococcus saxobsidens]|uniref:Site-specific recombinase XerC n=1 Tax=Blastococcus saxobsidens TaxID=138336 RepID=A0A4Q7YA18_9ACTN|nr:site-specific recombinase XerC [Blastococcus saxobsidens]
MGRPALPIGTFGKIKTYPTQTGYRARCLYRDYDGKVRSVEKAGRTKAGAEAALKLALRDRGRVVGSGDITSDTRVRAVAELWFAGLRDKSPTTLESYRRILDRHIVGAGPKPAGAKAPPVLLADLRLRELTIGIVDRFLLKLAEQHGAATAKLARSVLSGICGLAARHDALDRNPVRDVSRVETTPRRAPRALTTAQARQLMAMVTYDDGAVSRDLPDFIAFMLATGVRIGEAAAMTWDAVDLDAGTVEVRSTVVRVKGQGLIAKSTKTDAGARALVLPSWCVEMLRGRGTDGAGPVFSAVRGGWRDPSNTQSDLRAAFTNAGFDWVTSHVLRKTVATVMDHAGLSSRAAADQLGHANPSMTADVYMGRKVASTGAAIALEALGPA